jgi:hypothetical protein
MPRSKDPNLPDVSALVKGRVYRLSCRNLAIGVFDGGDSFIGIRTKFGNRFLDAEHHWDRGMHGTVANAVDTGVTLPEDIQPTQFDNPKLFEFLDALLQKETP